MHYSTALLALLATTSLASPAHKAPSHSRDVSKTSLKAEAIIFAVESTKCKWFRCLDIIDTADCIIDSLPDVKKTLACVRNDAASVSAMFSLALVSALG
jgi:hypothetical protein